MTEAGLLYGKTKLNLMISGCYSESTADNGVIRYLADKSNSGQMARLIVTVLFFLLSLLCVFDAPTYNLWYVSILATEFSWIFVLGTALLLFWGFKVGRFRGVGTIVGVAALALFLWPMVCASYISASVGNKLEIAFGADSSGVKDKNGRRPFSPTHIFAGRYDEQVPYVTMPYSTCREGPLTLDFYKAQLPGKRPCVIVVHGGSWTSGDSRQLPELNSYLATCGYHVVSINYRLVPAYQSPAPVQDVKAALAYLRMHAAELAIDTTNFVLLGRSAGGQIVLNAAYTLHDAGIKGVIDFYGPTDMVWGYSHPANPAVLNTCKIMEDYLGGTYAQVPQNYTGSSATSAINNQSPPTLIIHGQSDPLVAYEHATRLADKLQEQRVPHFLLSLPWATHGCDYTLNGPAGQLSTYTITRFMHVVTGR